MKTRTAVAGLALASSLTLGTSARADSDAAAKAASAALFADAKSLVADGRFSDACPKFEEAQRLFPTAGTLLNLGDCYERSTPPRTASAWGAFQQAEAAASKAGDAAREEEGARRARAIQALLSRVSITIAPAARLPGLEVKWDARPVGEGLLGTAIPVDPGEHALEASAPGRKTWKATVKVAATPGTTPAEVPVLELLPAKDPTLPAAPASPPGFWSAQRTAGAVVAGVGVGGVVVGSVLGLLVGGKKSSSAEHCLAAQPNVCDPEGVALRGDAYAFANASNVTFAIGGAALIGGVIVMLTAPSTKPASVTERHGLGVQPMLTLGAAGMAMRGEW